MQYIDHLRWFPFRRCFWLYIMLKVAPFSIVFSTMKVSSRFMCGSVVDLVGAGDSFRAGITAYLSRNAEAFKNDHIDAEQAVQMGNLFASLYIKSPLGHRYDNIGDYAKMLKNIESGTVFDNFDELTAAIKGRL